MTKQQITAGIYTVLTACVKAATQVPGGVPNGHLYAQLMNEFELEQWQGLIGLMKTSGLITETNHLLQITPKGADVFAKLDAIFKEAK